jgi:DNA ligase 1
MITKPMLAVNADLDKLDFTHRLYATPKLDGIRCLKINGKALSRKFKDIPNHHVRELIEMLPDGLDGELICEGKTFNETQSLIMREEGEPDFTYYVFDYVNPIFLEEYYAIRMSRLEDLKLPSFCKKLIPVQLKNESELNHYEAKCLNEGYEGVMVRDPRSPYKCGRSTVKEGYLLKIKRFEDAEAIILGFEEKMHNNNEKKTDELGHSKRSSHKENLAPADTLGALIVRDIKTDVEFSIGSGFDDVLKKEIWYNRDRYLNKIVTYKYQPSGMKDKPRFPAFKGFRDERDL